MNPGRKFVPVHPVLLAVYPILFLYAHNVDFAPLSEALGPMVVAAGVALLLLSALTLILRDKQRAALLVSLLALLFFS